jgi:hypothetical protein
MAMVAHDPAAAKRTGVPQSVAKEFNAADAKSGILRKKKKKNNNPMPMMGKEDDGY